MFPFPISPLNADVLMLVLFDTYSSLACTSAFVYVTYLLHIFSSPVSLLSLDIRGVVFYSS